ncbi:hypothetical protein WR25_06416 [Diploscapter pachys]|uniref:Uncharacterized protein n=1 Tax=Diploscapter pachys TaxID=2018661 RepID=A0A2A2M3H3_9BILA|nr:hypothetical protein WR25_06416 [Diploscapter pachys]
MRFSQPTRATLLSSQLSSLCAGTRAWLNRIERSGSMPAAIIVAAVQVGDEVHRLAALRLDRILHRDPLFHRAKVIAEVEIAGGLDTGHHSFREGALCGHGRTLGLGTEKLADVARLEGAGREHRGGIDECAGADQHRHRRPADQAGAGGVGLEQIVEEVHHRAHRERGGEQARRAALELRVDDELAALDERAIQQRDVDRAGDRGGERRPHMLERHDQREVERQVHAHRDRRVAHRRLGVGAGVIARRQHLHEDVGR